MKRNGVVLFVGMMSLLAFGIANADFNVTVQSPEDVAGVIPGGTPFTIDIWINYTSSAEPPISLSGLTFGVQLYSDDGSIATVTHRDVGGPAVNYPNVTYSSEWIAAYGAIVNEVNKEEIYGFNGTLPDSAYFFALGFGGGLEHNTNLNHIQLALQVDYAVSGTEGRLCIDSIGKAPPPRDADWDWKIAAHAAPGTFAQHPYCWTLTGLQTAGINELASEDSNLPDEFSLGQNYPNPFNPRTNFEFALPHQSFVKINIFNVLGQNIKTLANEEFAAGRYLVDWDGTTDSGTKAASGIYFYRMEADNFSATKKLMLLK